MHAQSTRSSPSSDWELGRQSRGLEDLERRTGKLEDHREKDKAELDRLKAWLERSFFLALLLVTSVTGHAVAPSLGTWIGTLMRALGGLRAG